jgi:neopullulanase
MTTPKWVTDTVFYEIFPDRFARSDRISRVGLNLESWDSPPSLHGIKGGDLYGVVEHLDYLEDLGIGGLYLTPVFTSAANHRYHTYDYYNVDPLLGGNGALRELLDAAHARNIRVVLDGVFNHASRGFWQFHHALENGAASPYKDWFHFDPDRLSGSRPWGAYPSHEAMEAIQQEGSLRAIGYEAWLHLPALPKFNTRVPAVREFIFSVAEYWIRFGIDGWRLDVPGEIDDDSFWQEFRRRVRAVNPEAYLIGEIWHDARRWLQGDQFDASMNYPVAAACLSFFSGRHLDVEETLRVEGYKGQIQPMSAPEFADRIDWCHGLYSPDVTRAQFNLLNSHDTPRFLTSVGGDLAALRLALTFLFSYPGVPCLFYGDEVGLAGRQDPECRAAFQWSEDNWNRDLRVLARDLIQMRKSHPALRWGDYQRRYADEGVYAFERSFEDDRLAIVLNASEEARDVRMGVGRHHPPKVLCGSARFRSSDGLSLRIPGRTGTIIDL